MDTKKIIELATQLEVKRRSRMELYGVMGAGKFQGEADAALRKEAERLKAEADKLEARIRKATK